ncbi:MAG TPA: hypothetical protein VFZ27_17870 [Terriglobia bacterium]|nr:hypothetical protein [Terriglobia bacterium]
MKLRALFFAVTAMFWLVPTAAATTLVRMSLRQLVQASSVIVQGEVVARSARLNASHTRVITYTTVQVEKVLKGQPPATIVIEQPGGTVGNVHVHVPGAASLRPQAQYVLFLEPVAGSSGTFHTVGMMQGAFRVYRERNRGQLHVGLPLGALATGAQAPTLSQPPSLGEFQMTISTAVAAPIVIPAGTLLPVVIVSTEFQGAGQAVVVASTTSDLFPSKAVVIPAGSRVVGNAQRTGTSWTIYWSSISVRGSQAHLSAVSGSSQADSLKGQSMMIRVR